LALNRKSEIQNMATVKDYSVEEKLSSVVKLQKIDSKLDNLQVLKGELPIEVSDLEDEIEGLHARQTRIEEEINGMQQFIEQKKRFCKRQSAG
jgi:predicted  nucleic acid-binding Zn-ribbon protein